MKGTTKAGTDCVITFLRSVPVFLNIRDQVLEEIRKRLTKKQFPKGRTIFQRDDPVETLYLVEGGRVEIYKTEDEVRRRLTLWYINPGEVFCVPTVLSGTAIASAEAVEPSIFYCLDRKDFEDLLDRFPELSLRFLKCLAGRIKGYSDSIHAVAFNDTTARLAEVLLKHGNSDDKGNTVCALTRNEITALAGTCRETVSRSLGRLKNEGLISIDQRVVIIKDVTGLRNRGSRKP